MNGKRAKEIQRQVMYQLMARPEGIPSVAFAENLYRRVKRAYVRAGKAAQERCRKLGYIDTLAGMGRI